MLTCKEIIDFLLDYVDGELSENKHAEFEKHLNVCPDCVAYIKSYNSTIELVKLINDSEGNKIPEKIPHGLVDAILTAKRK